MHHARSLITAALITAGKHARFQLVHDNGLLSVSPAHNTWTNDLSMRTLWYADDIVQFCLEPNIFKPNFSKLSAGLDQPKRITVLLQDCAWLSSYDCFTMVLSLAILALFATVTWAAPKAGGPKKLADAFTVWGVKGSADESKTGIGPFDPKSPDSCVPYYDHDVDVDAKSGKQLNNQWKQIIDLNSAALDALSRNGYESQLYSRNYAKSFFGFNPRMVAGKELLPGGASLSRDVALHRHAVDWYSRVDDQIKRANSKSPKPILACGSKFLTLRRPSDCHLIGKGKCEKKPGTNEDLTEKEHYGAEEFEHKHIFWAGAPFYVYWALDRDDDLFTSEWPVDSSIGAAHYCSHEANYAWKTKFGPETPAIIILCPNEITGKRVHDLVDTTPRKETKALDTMEVKALTLYHELFHMFEFQGRVTDDTPIWVAKSKKG